MSESAICPSRRYVLVCEAELDVIRSAGGSAAASTRSPRKQPENAENGWPGPGPVRARADPCPASEIDGVGNSARTFPFVVVVVVVVVVVLTALIITVSGIFHHSPRPAVLAESPRREAPKTAVARGGARPLLNSRGANIGSCQ